MSGDIKNRQVKAAVIAADAVGGSELIDVTKLLFGECTVPGSEGSTSIAAGSVFAVACNIDGIEPDDSAIATVRKSSECFQVNRTTPTDKGHVDVRLRNECTFATTIGSGTIAVLVYDR